MKTFGLYERERSRMPIEDVIELKRKNISVVPITGANNSSPRIPAFMIQFAYPDRFVAQRVTQDLVSRYIDEKVRGPRPAIGLSLEMLDPASLPRNPVSPRASRIVTMGLALGLAAGSVVAFASRARKPMWASSGILEKSPTGKSVFRGTDVPVQAMLEYLESDKTMAQFLDDFPTVTRAAAVSALGLAKSSLVR